MAIITSSDGTGTAAALTNSVRTQYQDMYDQEVYFMRLYDQLSVPIGRNMNELIRGSSVQVNFLGKMDIGVTDISEVQDITPQALKDAIATIVPVSRGEALQMAQQIEIRNFLNDYMERLSLLVAENAAESIDVLARNAALQGSLVDREVARNLLNAGSTGHRATETRFANAAARLAELKAPMFVGVGDEAPLRRWMAITNPYVFADIRQDGSVQAVGQYQQGGIHINYELGELGPFRFSVSPWAKVFFGAGAANAAVVDTTLAAATTKLDQTLTVAAPTNMASVVDRFITIGTEETGDTHQVDNERVRLTGFTGSTATIVGEGANAGMRFSHPSTTAVRSADSAHTIIFGGPGSIAKVYAPEVGEFGELVGPLRDGTLKQFWTLGYKWWGGYAIIAENRILRVEVSVSAEV